MEDARGVQELGHVPMGNDATGTTGALWPAPTHDGMHRDFGDVRDGLNPVEFLDDRVGWFASHNRNVRYSYKLRKSKCTKMLTASNSPVCENQTMADAETQRFIEWIKTGLKTTGKTQKALAEHLNIEHPQITKLLQGKRALKVGEVPRIAAFLGIPPPWNEKWQGDIQTGVKRAMKENVPNTEITQTVSDALDEATRLLLQISIEKTPGALEETQEEVRQLRRSRDTPGTDRKHGS